MATPKQHPKINDLAEVVKLVEEYAQDNQFINLHQFNNYLAKTKSQTVDQKLFESALAKSELCGFEAVRGAKSQGWLIFEAKSAEMDTDDAEGVMSDSPEHYYDNSQPGPDDTESYGEPLGQQADVNNDDDIALGEVSDGGTPYAEGHTREKDIDLKDSIDDNPDEANWNLSNNLGSVVKESAVAGGLKELRANYKIISEGVRKAIELDYARMPNAPKNATRRFVVESTSGRFAVKEPYKALSIAEELVAVGNQKNVNISIIAESSGNTVRSTYKVPALKQRSPLMVENRFLFASKDVAAGFADAASKKNHTSKLIENKYGTAVSSTMNLQEALNIVKTLSV